MSFWLGAACVILGVLAFAYLFEAVRAFLEQRR